MDPPVPCGTVIRCHFPCTRPPPPCGHPKQQHDCHETDECPPCIYLVEKACVCGKNTVANVPCHRSRVSCGQTCDAVLNCGFHRCQRSCHESGECASCHQTCTKPRKCGHACPEPCHAPAACPETEPCQAWVTLLCACGHQQQQVRCGHSMHSPLASDRTLKCSDACLVAQRNAKLAEALGLNPSDKAQQPTEYPSSTLTFFANNRRFAEEVEDALVEFIKSYRHAVLFTPASSAQRTFMHELAGVFGLQSENVDEEPKKSVAVRRSMHARIPSRLLNEAYVQHKSSLARLRPTSLAQLKRSDSPGASSSPSPALLNCNALLLRGVFGVEESQLTSALRKVTAAAPMHLKWLDDEDVVAIVSGSNTVRLRQYSQELRNMAHLNPGYNRLAKDVVVCYCDESGKIVRTDSGASTAGGAGGSSRTTASAWATVAANATPAPSAIPPRTIRGASPVGRSGTPPSQPRPAASLPASMRSSPHLPPSMIPESWDT